MRKDTAHAVQPFLRTPALVICFWNSYYQAPSLTSASPPLLWAVHISDGVLAHPWLWGGFLLTAALAALGAFRVRDEEIPRIALLTAAFFLASLVHVRVGPTSVHLLLNGLAGILLGWRAALAIPLAVTLQAVLFGHGGFSAVGVNSCVMTAPALAAGLLFGGLRRSPLARLPGWREGLVTVSAFCWLLALVFSVAVLAHRQARSPSGGLDLTPAVELTFHPATGAAALLVAALVAWFERRAESAPEFPLGLLVGGLTVLATIGLNCAVLLAGGETNWTTPALLLVVAHLPVAVVEGIVAGFTVGFLAKVKPELLGLRATAPVAAAPPPPAPVSAPRFRVGESCCFAPPTAGRMPARRDGE